MNQLIREAFFIGLKEGAKLSFAVFLVLSFFKNARHEGLFKPLFAGILVVFILSLAVFNITVTPELRAITVKLIGYVFGVFYLLSLGALFHATGVDMLGPFRTAVTKTYVITPAVFFLTTAYFLPDMMGSSLYIADLFSLIGGRIAVFAAAGSGFFLCVLAGGFVGRKIRRDRMKLFGLPQVLLFLALIKLAAGGVRGFAELSLIPSVQAGLMKLIHDVIHQTFVTLLVPDHMVLTTTAWNFIAVFFGNTAGLWLSLVIMILPLLFFIQKHFSEEPSAPPEHQSGALRRKFIKSFRDERLLKSIPVFFFLAFITGVWLIQQDESIADIYIPEPKPVTATEGVVALPLHSPLEDLLDGNLHKYRLTINGETVPLLIMKKPDGTLAFCLDACEVCPPDGYGRRSDHVVCLNCNTPIPFDAVGKPGGCNPIPVTAIVTDREIKAEVTEILKKWKTVNSGKGREPAKP